MTDHGLNMVLARFYGECLRLEEENVVVGIPAELGDQDSLLQAVAQANKDVAYQEKEVKQRIQWLEQAAAKLRAHRTGRAILRQAAIKSLGLDEQEDFNKTPLLESAETVQRRAMDLTGTKVG